MAQPEHDGASTYIDAWGDPSGLFGHASTYGIYDHQYQIDITITSPDARQASESSYYEHGFVSKSTVLVWDEDDLGQYSVTANYYGYCPYELWGWFIASRTLVNFVGSSMTTGTPIGEYFFPDFYKRCDYEARCMAGSQRSCPASWPHYTGWSTACPGSPGQCAVFNFLTLRMTPSGSPAFCLSLGPPLFVTPCPGPCS